jgi:hypothetical protein
MWESFSIDQELKAEGQVVLDVGRLLPESIHPAVPLTCETSFNGFRWRIGVEWRGTQERKGETCMLTGVGYGAPVEGSRQQHWSDGRVGTGALVFLDGLVFKVECLGLDGDTGGAEAIRPMEMRWMWVALVDEKAVASDDAEGCGVGEGLEVMTTDRKEVESVSSSSSSKSWWSSSMDEYDEDWLPPSEESVSSASVDAAGSGEAAGGSEGASANSDEDSSDSDEAGSAASPEAASTGVYSSTYSESSYSESDSGSESGFEADDDGGPWQLCGLQKRKGYFPGHACFDWGMYRSQDWPRRLMEIPQMKKVKVIRKWSFDSSFIGKGVVMEEPVGEDEQVQAVERHGGVWLRCYLYCR